MSDGPKVKGNPLLVSVCLLVICYIIGEFVIPKYSLLYPINLIGILGLIISLVFFLSGFKLNHCVNKGKTVNQCLLFFLIKLFGFY